MKHKENSRNNTIFQSIRLTSLPTEILFQCFSYLKSLKDLVSLSKTNHTLRAVALDKSLWQNYQHYLPNPVIKKKCNQKKSSARKIY